MISYQLVCDRGDRFDAWFRSSAAYEVEATAHRVQCPDCGSTIISKALMSPAVRSTGRRRGVEPVEVTSVAPPAAKSDAVRFAAGPDPVLAEAMDLMRRITRHVREHADDVGPRFADEARKIHYKEAPPRSIVGQTTSVEARELLEEGIDFHQLPILPEDHN